MNSFFKGFTRGLIALLPVCLIICILFAGNRLLSSDGTSVPTDAAASDSGTFKSNTSDSAPSEDTILENRMPDSRPSAGFAASQNSSKDPGSASAAPAEDETPKATEWVLSFAGDVLFTENTLSRYAKQGISSMFSEELLSAMTGSDLFMLNEEFPFSTRGEAAADKQFTFRVDPSYVRIFQEMGTDVVTVANNHALDFGTDAFLDTLRTLDQAQISRVGGGSTLEEAKAPARFPLGDKSVGILGASRVIPVSSWAAGSARPGMFTAYDQAPLLTEIASLSTQCDYTIVYLHWGIEKEEYPQEYQRKLAYACIDAGADLVIGSHPHVLQGFETYHDKLIVYSLGNYLFSNNTNPTVLLQVHIPEDGSLTASLLPCSRINGQLQRNPSPAALFSHLTELSFGMQVTQDADGNGQLSPAAP